MQVKYIISFMIISLSFINISLSENVDRTYTPPSLIEVPKSPEASAFTRVQNVPVSQYSGTMNFSIPLYIVKSGDISLPISLDYQGTAIPVEQEATWVGLNWLLNAGGMITVQMGLHNSKGGSLAGEWDKAWNHFLNKLPLKTIYYDGEFQVGCKISGQQPALGNYGQNWFKHGQTDSDSNDDVPSLVYEDILGYNNGEAPCYHAFFCGNSLDFVWDQFTKEFMIIGKNQNYQIEGTPVIITITDGNGVKYCFSEIEETKPEGENVDMDRTPVNYTIYLTSIESPNGHKIKLMYENEGVYFPVRHVTETLYDNNYPSKILYDKENYEFLYTPTSGNYSLARSVSPYYVISKKRLKEIVADNLSVLFQAKTDRKDLNVRRNSTSTTSQSSVKRLDCIEIQRTIGKEKKMIKKYEFSYSYFGKNTCGGNILKDYWAERACADVYSDYYPNDDFLYERLRLDRLTEIGSDESRLPSYIFGYYAIDLPGKNSASQDYWGYYNGKENYNGKFHSMLPRQYENSYDNAYSFQSNSSNPSEIYADRRSELKFAMASMLTSVVHPTGAVQSFTYELNTFTNCKYPSLKNGITPNNPIFNMHTTDPVLGPSTLPNPQKTSVSTYNCNLSNYSIPDISKKSQFFMIHTPQYVLVSTTFTKNNGREKAFWNDFYKNIPMLYHYKCTLGATGYTDYVSGANGFPLSVCDTTNSETVITRYDTLYLNPGRYKIQIDDFANLSPKSTANHRILMTVSPITAKKEVSYGCGIRIESIKTNNGEKSELTKYYYDDNSGILMNPPVFARKKLLVYQPEKELWHFAYYSQYVDRWAEQTENITYMVECSHNLSPNSSSVGYGTVSENSIGSNGETIKYKEYSFWNKLWGGLSFDFVKRIADPRNGMIQTLRVFDENHDLKFMQKTEFQLSKSESRYLSGIIENCYYGPNYTVNGVYNPWASAIHGTGIMDICIYPSVRFDILKTKTIEHTYEGFDTLTNSSEVIFNTANCMPLKQIYTSSVEKIQDSIRYWYPFEYDNSWAKSMTKSHINNIPVYVSTYHGSTLTSGNWMVYNNYGQRVQLWQRSLKSQVLNDRFFSSKNFKKVQSSEYDAETGNLRSITDASGLTTVYIWGYRSKYPIAEVVGATLAQVKSIIVNLAALEASGIPTITSTELHRKLSSIKGTSVTTYSYDDYIGMTSMTQPNGQTKYFSYDGFGQLNQVADSRAQVEAKYIYHFKK